MGNHSFVLQWKDYIYDCCGSSSATSNNECYERVTVRINIVAPLAVTSTSLACPPTTAGTVNVKTAAGITGGCTPVYSLFDNGVQVGSSNTSGVFNLPTTLTGPITVTVTSGCPTISGCPADCNNSQTISINNACRQAPPPCPTFGSLGSCTTLSGPVCPGNSINLGVSQCGIPDLGVIEWVQLANPSDDPYSSGTVIATQVVDYPNTPIINEVNITSEQVEIYGLPGTDLSCMILTDGENNNDLQIPAGTLIPTCGYITFTLLRLIWEPMMKYIFLTHQEQLLFTLSDGEQVVVQMLMV
ncbi:MAG: hypothetical protein IPL08_06040 [Saprospiraceae bacterium]|nr:hypothetical protein [Saprospiraceae bacterium]